MAQDSTITINPSKRSDLEFDVIIQGMDDISNIPLVRFVMTSESLECDCSFRCKKIEGEKHKWIAKLPVLSHIKENTLSFHVEVIIDGYYFEPAGGLATLVADPVVKFQPTVGKPTVSTSFTVKQTDEEVSVVESGATSDLGQIAPTTALLKPEYDPDFEEGNVKIQDAPKFDQLVDTTRLSDVGTPTVPGPGAKNEPQDDGKTDDENNAFDARTIADSIVRTVRGKTVAPTGRGSLLRRDQQGNAVVAGLDTPATALAKATNATRVKEILKST